MRIRIAYADDHDDDDDDDGGGGGGQWSLVCGQLCPNR